MLIFDIFTRIFVFYRSLLQGTELSIVQNKLTKNDLKMKFNQTCIILLFFQHQLLAQDHICSKSYTRLYEDLLITASTSDDSRFDITSAAFHLTIDPNQKFISGRVEMSITSLAHTLTDINLQLSTQLTIDSIAQGSEKLVFNHTGMYDLSINLNDAIVLDSSTEIIIHYHGAPPSTGFGSISQSFHSGQPLLFSFSVPYGSRDWWPTKNGNTDKIDSIKMYITTLEEYRAASNGKLVSELNLGNGYKQYHWEHKYPIVPYLIAFAITNYEAYEDQCVFANGDTMQVLNYVYPESITSAKMGTERLLDALIFFDTLLIPYPFRKEKYGHAQFSWGGGMEHQTMSFVTNFDFALLAHELAHQWFGDMATCASWKDCWLNEGFATYMEGLCQERFNPGTWLAWKKNKIANIVSSAAGSVFIADTTNINRIFNSRLTYNKGAMILHQLRWLMGDEYFFNSLKAYLNKVGHGFATTEMLKVTMEEESGLLLTEYFNDYYYGQGYPRYKVIWQAVTPNKLLIQLNQTPVSSNVSFFEIDVPLRCSNANNTLSENIRLSNIINNQIFEVELPFECKKIEFDPHAWLISSGNLVINDTITSTQKVLNDDINIIPNPAQDNIRIEGIDAAKFDYKIIDEYGMICTRKQNASDNEINIANLSQGTYFIELITKSKNATLRFVKVK
jgi:aminopeptidase N